ncbi:MAG: hypothetical protein V3V43_04780, partial [Dehalococcoidales bacterium]
MPKKLSPKQLFLLLCLSTVAFGATVYLLFMRALMSGLREPPDSPWSWFLFFLWPFGVPLVLLAIFFVVVAIPRFRIALAKIEIPKEYSLKHFLLLMWLTAQAFLMGVVLHNAIYGLFMLLAGWGVWGSSVIYDEPVFFFIALYVVPIGFGLGAIGRIWEWAVVKPVEEMKGRGIHLPTAWRYFAPIGCCAWLWRFGKGIEAI